MCRSKIFIQRVLSIALLLAAGLPAGLPLHAGSLDHTLKIPNVEGLKDNLVTAQVLLDSAAGDIQGWSFGVCYDPAFVTLEQASLGSTAASVNGGSEPDFLFIGETSGGVNMLAVVCYTGCATLGVGTDHELLRLDYRIDTVFNTSSALTLCETIGNPPTQNLLSISNAGIAPTLVDGTIASVAPDIAFIAETKAGGYNPATGVGTFLEPIYIEELPDSPGFANLVQGFSMAFAYDPLLLMAESVVEGADLIAIDGGEGPDFFAPATGPDSVTVGVVFAFLGGVFMELNGQQHVVDVEFTTNASTLAGNLTGTTTSMIWADNIGVVPTVNVAVVLGDSYPPIFVDGLVTLIPIPPVENLNCATQAGSVEVTLSWSNPAIYDSILVLRNGAEMASLVGTATTFTDLNVGPGIHQYEIIPLSLGADGPSSNCNATISPPLSGLTCNANLLDVDLSWDMPALGYDSIKIFRGGVEIQSLPGNTTNTTDAGVPPGLHDYMVVGEVATVLSGPLTCQVEVFDQPSFIRGDSNTDGTTNIADPIANLSYLFSGSPSMCLDAQDVNDDGTVNIADPVYHLTFLFQSGPPPWAPFPECGQDPTEDLTECNEYPPCL